LLGLQQEITQGMYTYIGIVPLPDMTLESCLRSIDIYIYIQRSATERITALYEEDRKPGVGLTLVPNLRKVRACSPNIFFLFQNES